MGEVAFPGTNLFGKLESLGFFKYADVLLPALLAYRMLDRAM